MRTRIFFLLLLCLAAAAVIFSIWAFAGLPPVTALEERIPPASIRIEDRQGRLLYEILSSDRGRNLPVPLSAMAACLPQATIATEDANFYTHPGVDLSGILRALWIDLQGGQVLAGGSTITQQVARLLLMDADERAEVSLRRKLRESLLAFQLTLHYSKDEILALYLNQSYYGSLAYGVEAAAQTYFGKSAASLDTAECALIAGLPQSPARYSPFIDEDAALQRQRVVLGLMEQNDQITAEQRRLAEAERLVFASTPYPMEAPHFSLLVKARLDALLPAEVIQQGGLTVRTTLDLDYQHIAEDAIQRQLEELAKSNGGLGHNTASAALVALNPADGAILALVGSPDYNDTEHAGAINMALAPRQPGSALKPLLYAAAFNPAAGQPWTAATMLLDVSQSFITHDGKSYTPANYDQRENGPVLAREALASSLNIPAVLAMQHVGVDNFLSFAGQLGLDGFGDPNQYDLSLALGGGDVRLLDLTAAYAAFANGGSRVEPFTIYEIRDTQGNLLYTRQQPALQPVMDSRVAWLISDILNDNNARSLGFGVNSILRLDRPAAVKTGTTSNFHDNWTVGYTPELVTGVWTGNTDYQPMLNVSGVSGAAPIWANFMRAALANRPERWFERPTGMVQTAVCANSGLLPSPGCPYQKLEWFLSGTQPAIPDTLNRPVILDSLTGSLAGPQTPPERQLKRLALDLPPLAQAWAEAHNILLWSKLAAGSASNAAGRAENAPALRLLTPADLAVYQISPSLPLDSQRIQISAASGKSGLLTFFADGQSFASASQPPYQAWWQLTLGQHTFWVEDASGSRSEPVTITVQTAP